MALKLQPYLENAEHVTETQKADFPCKENRLDFLKHFSQTSTRRPQTNSDHVGVTLRDEQVSPPIKERDSEPSLSHAAA